MSDDIDDVERLRLNDGDDTSRFNLYDDYTSAHGPPVLAVTKTVSSYPTTAGKFFAVSTLTLTGTETEGSNGVTTAQSDTFYAYLPAGAAIPATGTQVLCVPVQHRWVIDY